ncbi:MAG TPA: IS66 family insertion sequence element accessory protein TnpB [Clostridia bacterium]|nr:IS66 family insertion sequence element accessory protein TnpB [Clostridia bacterium]
MDIREYRKASQQNEWAEMVRACKNSGKTVAAWCKENGIGTKTYYYRQKKVSEAIPDPRKIPALKVPEIGFVELPVQHKESTAITVQIGNAAVQIHNGADVETVGMVIRVLSGIC